jgi:receptor protein-tyrosine kinase
MADRTSHLVERVAAQLRAGAGLAAEPAADFNADFASDFSPEFTPGRPRPAAPGRAAGGQPRPPAVPRARPSDAEADDALDAAAVAAAAARAAPPDAPAADLGPPDLGPPDAGLPDTLPEPGAREPGAREAGAREAGAREAGARETGAADALDMATLKRGGLALAGVRSRITEDYRITVGRILRALRSTNRTGTGAANLVMVTSARPGEGKSFSALNLAASIAQNGLSDVLLVDVDAKPRSMTSLLGLRDRPGLLDIADNPALRPEDTALRTAVEGLSVMPIGVNRTANADAGVTRALAAAIERIRRRFPHHVLMLDTPPCLSTSDPSTLAPLVDQVIMVVEAGRTQRSELGASLELVKACPNVILVLNKVRLTHRHSFGSYYYFGYPS